MSERRTLALYAGLMLGFAVVVCRLFWLCSNTTYAAKAAAQSTITLQLPARRGNFYDCDGELLTGLGQTWYALCVPGQKSYARLYAYADADGQALLYRNRNAMSPFLLELGQDVSALGVWCCPSARRYSAVPLCAHLLGYIDGEGHGVTGLEAALDGLLTGSGAHDTLLCTVTAQGGLRTDTEPERIRADSGAVGVRLTISRKVQRAAEAIASRMMTAGCIVVMDTSTASVRASVSVPGFDPENVSVSLDAADSPLVNRAFSAYAVGSVFKPVLAAAALEQSQASLTHDCLGCLAVGDQVFRCAGGIPHGEVDLGAALQKSCNGYFIRLGQALGVNAVRDLAARLGFGEAVVLTETYRTSAGTLPTEEALGSEGQFANFCFGQGELLATPLQVAAMMNAIASDGVWREPVFLDCTLDEASGQMIEAFPAGQTRSAFSSKTAAQLRALLAGVVTDGTGREAAPSEGIAGGKTGTAQTGQFRDGEELKNYWFAGFYPADDPQYTIVVLQDGQIQPAHSSAAIFAAVCDALAIFESDDESTSLFSESHDRK